jgi:hypothetical protein
MGAAVSVNCHRCGSTEVLAYPNRRLWVMRLLALWHRLTGRWGADVPLCPECCDTIEGHDYEYERSERHWFCRHCGVPASDQWVSDRWSD